MVNVVLGTSCTAHRIDRVMTRLLASVNSNRSARSILYVVYVCVCVCVCVCGGGGRVVGVHVCGVIWCLCDICVDCDTM